MNKIDKYVKEWEGKRVDFDGVYGYQCVDLIRHFFREVYKENLGPTWGSARGWWLNSVGNFNSRYKRVENNLQDQNQVPRAGDIIFFDGGRHGHVWIVVTGYKGENRIDVLEQNGGSGNGDGLWNNSIRVHSYTYNRNAPLIGNVLGWYTGEEKEKEQHVWFYELFFKSRYKRSSILEDVDKALNTSKDPREMLFLNLILLERLHDLIKSNKNK